MEAFIVIALILWIPVVWFAYSQARRVVGLIYQQRMVELLLEERAALRRREFTGTARNE